jgi:hypothetical protein
MSKEFDQSLINLFPWDHTSEPASVALHESLVGVKGGGKYGVIFHKEYDHVTPSGSVGRFLIDDQEPLPAMGAFNVRVIAERESLGWVHTSNGVGEAIHIHDTAGVLFNDPNLGYVAPKANGRGYTTEGTYENKRKLPVRFLLRIP